MRRHVARRAPLEACGLLAGNDCRVEIVLPIANAVQSRVRFRMEPLVQLYAFDWIETHGLELVGIFHSHPTGPGTPSQIDFDEAAYPVAQVIWSRHGKGWQARGFWIELDQAAEILLQIIES